ncbi:MAG: DnaJ domain-containing protein [archaeon]
MALIKGHEFNVVIAKNSFDRRALQYKNNIIGTLKKIGISEDYIDIELEKIAFKKAPAKVSWYIEGNQLHFSYIAGGKFVDNLYIISKVLELEIEALLYHNKTMNEFISTFSEEGDIDDERRKARETLGVSNDTNDFDAINRQFKTLAKECHPDMSSGDIVRFKELNRAHKILRRELE